MTLWQHRFTPHIRTTMTSLILPNHDIAQRARPPQRLPVVIAKLAFQEFLVVAGTAYAAGMIYQNVLQLNGLQASLYLTAALFLAATVETVSFGFGHYRNILSQSRHAFLWSGVGATALAFSFLLSALFLLKVADPYSRGIFIFQFFAVQVAVLTVRAVLYARLQAAIAVGQVNARRVVLIGDPSHCARFSSRLKATGIRTVSSFPFSGPVGDESHPDHGRSELRRLIDGCRRVKPDDILILSRQDSLPGITGLVGPLSEVPAGLHIVLVEAADLLAAARIVEFGNTVTMQVLQPPLPAIGRIAKRIFDVVVASVALVALSPLFIMVAMAIKLDSRGPILFRQTRHGYNNETIKVFKLRTMTTLEDGDHFVQATRNDPRITRIGGVLRRTNIDELPQLLNVLRGEMSIVGPRPHATAHNKMYEGKISVFSRRHVVKPGITGWAQVNGNRGSTDTLEKMQRRVECDLYYIDNWSFWFDIRIVILTLFSKAAYKNAC